MAQAQTASPSLTARVAGVNSEATQSRKLRIDRLDVRVRIHGTIAETVITARFGNAGRENLEGDFTLAMPAGSVVTGYALDIGDRMVDGVLVDQRQGRIAYEARVRQRIDPGLAEVGRDNMFRTRVFPILPGLRPHDPAALHDPARSAHRLCAAGAGNRRDRRILARRRGDRNGGARRRFASRATSGRAGPATAAVIVSR